MRVHIATLGCRLNQSESDRIARELAAIGHEIVAEASLAELQVVNTCAVTHKATRESATGRARRAARRAAGDDGRDRLRLADRSILAPWAGRCW